ncbi:MAG: phospho-N-acetylmuramoyl-pentapeptide-transferase [Lachnospiraceae bacterium]|nr:phospho-N-acetylmuramoyl-pentapeptide-transferase [Lachnospiraceae bacterium]
MLQELVFPAWISFLIALVIGPKVISFLRGHKMRQTAREELESHQKKTGTPTMGGIMFLVAFLVTGLLWAPTHPHIIPVLILSVGFGIIGFLDDFLKAILHRTDGLLAWQKMLLQILVTTGFCYYVTAVLHLGLWMRVPFWPEQTVDIGILAIPLMYFAVIGTVNGTNFTDGVDGLASSVTVVVAAFFVAASFRVDAGVVPAGAAMMGGLLAFLVYNCYPAQIFMGDTGSLALGGFVAGMAYMMHSVLFIPIVGFIYMIEVISVILQVGYFKKTHGKRIFRMAPIHHHFELGGWSETKVVAVFSVVTILLCLLAYGGI